MNTSQDMKMKMVDDSVRNQNVENMDGLGVVLKISYQYGNGNVVTAPDRVMVMVSMQQMQIAQEEEAWIQSTQEEFEFMTAADAYEETERVKVNCTSEDTLQQASTSRIQSNNAPVYDSDGSTEVWSYAKENEHLKTTYKNLFDSIKVTQTRTKSIIDSLQKQLHDTIYENAKLRAQLFDKVSEPKGTTKGTRMNTMFTKQSILRKPHSSSFKPKLYYVAPFPKSLVLPKVDKTNVLSKSVTSNSAPSTRESKVVQTVKVIVPRIFRTNPSKASRVDDVVPNKPVKTSVRIKLITVSQPNVIHKQQANSNSNNFFSTSVNNTAKTRRPHPKSNSNTDRVSSKSKSSCLSNNIKKIEENHKNF
uniref:Uncharacterized protein n=1 Tax=Tanacetum cinerariifolium TaxID=118510 RepID=A0A6L2M3C8_TANCI|nr:hypothetical protein [Tanacetum cinerariifolium]